MKPNNHYFLYTFGLVLIGCLITNIYGQELVVFQPQNGYLVQLEDCEIASQWLTGNPGDSSVYLTHESESAIWLIHVISASQLAVQKIASPRCYRIWLDLNLDDHLCLAAGTYKEYLWNYKLVKDQLFLFKNGATSIYTYKVHTNYFFQDSNLGHPASIKSVPPNISTPLSNASKINITAVETHYYPSIGMTVYFNDSDCQKLVSLLESGITIPQLTVEVYQMTSTSFSSAKVIAEMLNRIGTMINFYNGIHQGIWIEINYFNDTLVAYSGIGSQPKNVAAYLADQTADKIIDAFTTKLELEKTIDKRNACDASGNVYYVVFCARGGSLTGHAFVTWYTEDNYQKMCISQSYGFYPEQGIGVFGAVPGDIQNEAWKPETTMVTHRLTVQVNEYAFLASQQLISRWETKDYSLWENNCINFCMEVAKTIGLTVPPKGTTTFPSTYLEKLITQN